MYYLEEVVRILEQSDERVQRAVFFFLLGLCGGKEGSEDENRAAQ